MLYRLQNQMWTVKQKFWKMTGEYVHDFGIGEDFLNKT